MLERVLKKADLPAEVRWVDNPNEVLFAAEDESVDIAVLNLELPGVDDVLVEELRMLEGSRRLPIIAFSDAEPEEADHVFPKPREDFEYFGIVHAIRIFWMSRAPSLAPPPPPKRNGRPRRASGIDVLDLPIQPVEAYLLSMLDGEMGIDEISAAIGITVKETRAMLRRLAELGAVAWRAPHPSLAPPAPERTKRAPVPSATARAPTPGATESTGRAVAPPGEAKPGPRPEPKASPEPKPGAAEGAAQRSGPEPEPAPVSEPKARAAEELSASRRVLTDERKKIIDDAYALLGEADHYELLGVPRDADKKAIRAAYFELAKLFHTDTLYGVDLADYGSKMDKVFRDLTEAYEVLSKNKKRRAYDAYLGVVRETKSLDAAPTPSLAPPAPAPEATPEPTPAPNGADSASSRTRVRDTAKAKRVARELLEKRMQRTGPQPKQEGAVEALTRTLRVVSRSYSKEDRAARLIVDADKAEAAGNLAGAAEALRIAAAWRPDDEALAERAEALRVRALAQKAPAYIERARYAERKKSWEEAALCWMKVCEVRPDDVDAAVSAARALLESRGDLREAALYAKRATELAPEDPSAHLLLAEIYVSAGMPVSARPVLRTVLRLSPRNPQAKEMLSAIGG